MCDHRNILYHLFNEVLQGGREHLRRDPTFASKESVVARRNHKCVRCRYAWEITVWKTSCGGLLAELTNLPLNAGYCTKEIDVVEALKESLTYAGILKIEDLFINPLHF